jgi:hypothetical protein
MKPIEIAITGHVEKTPEEICEEILVLERWSEFEGYSILPGIKHAQFETKTPNLVGSRIRVKNTDGSSHIEEIIEWNPASKVAFRFQEFQSPLRHLASYFVESWTFNELDEGTQLSRAMSMVPRGVVGWLMLYPISRLMKKAFSKQAALKKG